MIAISSIEEQIETIFKYFIEKKTLNQKKNFGAFNLIQEKGYICIKFQKVFSHSVNNEIKATTFIREIQLEKSPFQASFDSITTRNLQSNDTIEVGKKSTEMTIYAIFLHIHDNAAKYLEDAEKETEKSLINEFNL